MSLLSAAVAAILVVSGAAAVAEPAAPTITPAPRRLEDRVYTPPPYSSYETTSPLPLTDYFYPYSQIPYQVNPFPVGRGPQSGYNQCNSTTEGPDALCQTLEMNSIQDFCFYGAPGTSPNETIGDVEAAVVAYCSKSGHGGRIFPEGTFSAIQFMKTEAYIQIVGFFNQSSVNLDSTDPGGELDPHGADLAGNPLGGLVYSTGFLSGDNVTYIQSESWNLFVGGGQFCLKLCDPGYNTTQNYCQNIYDLIGCNYNMPADYTTLQTEKIFISCEGDLQDEVGTYTSNGQTLTWSQPSSLPASSTLPWTPRIPASSNCVTYQSTDLFPPASLGYQSGSAASSSSSTSAMSSTSTGTSTSPSGSRSGSSASVSASATASPTKSSGALRVAPSFGIVALVLAGICALFA